MRLAGLILLTAALLLFVRIARAEPQEILVRSGDHPGFTRLVFYFDGPVASILQNDGAEASITFPDGDYRFDLSGVFQRISNRRLLSIDAPDNAGGLRFDLASNHYIVAFETEEKRLVLDIQPGRAATHETRLNGTTRKKPPEMIVLPAPAPPDIPLASDLQPELSPRIVAARNTLITELGEALAQGLLTPNPQPDRTDSAEAGTHSSDPAVLDHLNLDATTAYEQGQNPRKPKRTEPGAHCLSDQTLRLFPIPPGEVFRTRYSELRRNLSSEIDKVLPSGLEALVRFLLGNGFGAEAIAMLNTYQSVLETESILKELGDILDHGSTDGKILAAQADCPGEALIWSILAVETDSPLGGISRLELESDFAQMPAALRKRIGPALILRLLDRGADDLARSIKNRVDRAPGTMSRFEPLIALRMGEDKTQSASDRYNVLKGDSVDALILRLTDALETGVELAESDLQDADNLAFEMRYSPRGQVLRRLAIPARARAGQINQALATLSHESVLEALSPEISKRIAAEVFAAATMADAREGEFVDAYFRYRTLLTNDPVFSAARQNVAGLLLDVGLVAEAARIIAPLLPAEDVVLMRLAAAIALESDQPQQALDLLEDDQSSEANAIRFEALLLLGRPKAALELPVNPEDETRRERIQWRNQKPAKSLSADPSAEILELSTLQERLEKSQNARSKSKEILAANPKP